MNKLILASLAVLFIGFSSEKALAQDAVPSGHPSVFVTAAVNNAQIISRSIFVNRDEAVCFVDAESLHYNLKSIVISNRAGIEIKRMNIVEEKVNAIHELPLESLEKGDYRITLNSLTSSESYPFSW
ncbi:MAG: hypothetical protein ABIV51_08300 [Saprospiraceae bacterium]